VCELRECSLCGRPHPEPAHHRHRSKRLNAHSDGTVARGSAQGSGGALLTGQHLSVCVAPSLFGRFFSVVAHYTSTVVLSCHWDVLWSVVGSAGDVSVCLVPFLHRRIESSRMQGHAQTYSPASNSTLYSILTRLNFAYCHDQAHKEVSTL
jgi:hypothetical protein